MKGVVAGAVWCLSVIRARELPQPGLSTTSVSTFGSRPTDHYFRSVCLSVCLFVCAEFFSAVFDPIWIKLGHMLHVRV